MIDFDKDFEEMEATCDGEGCNFADTYFGDFQECIESMKEDGWLISYIDDEYYHYCPACRVKEDFND